jgi:hypothetical protein
VAPNRGGPEDVRQLGEPDQPVRVPGRPVVVEASVIRYTVWWVSAASWRSSAILETRSSMRRVSYSAEASGRLVGPPVFKTGEPAKAGWRVRFPSASATGWCPDLGLRGRAGRPSARKKESIGDRISAQPDKSSRVFADIETHKSCPGPRISKTCPPSSRGKEDTDGQDPVEPPGGPGALAPGPAGRVPGPLPRQPFARPARERSRTRRGRYRTRVEDFGGDYRHLAPRWPACLSTGLHGQIRLAALRFRRTMRRTSSNRGGSARCSPISRSQRSL